MHELSSKFSCFLAHFGLNLGKNSFRNFEEFILFGVIFTKLSLNFTRTRINDVSKELLGFISSRPYLNRGDQSEYIWFQWNSC